MWTEREKLFLQVIIAQDYCCSKHSVLERVQQKPYSWNYLQISILNSNFMYLRHPICGLSPKEKYFSSFCLKNISISDWKYFVAVSIPAVL